VFPVGQITAAWWAVPLRLVVGYGFIAHGYAKLSRGPSGFAAILQALDVPVPDVMAWATILVEFVGFAVILAARGASRPSPRSVSPAHTWTGSWTAFTPTWQRPQDGRCAREL
jgi:hypothetical protein